MKNEKTLKAILAENLKHLRGQLSQSQFALKLGLNQATYHRYEKGENFPTDKVLLEMSDRLGYTESALVSPNFIYSQIAEKEMLFTIDTATKLVALQYQRKIKSPNDLMRQLIDEAYDRECASEPAGQSNPSLEYPQKPTTASPIDKMYEQLPAAVREITSQPSPQVSAPKKPVKK